MRINVCRILYVHHTKCCQQSKCYNSVFLKSGDSETLHEAWLTGTSPKRNHYFTIYYGLVDIGYI